MAEGQKGLLDFVGYSVGVEAPPPFEGGFVGLLDFTGIPVGNAGAPPAPSASNFVVMIRRRKRW